MYAVGDVIKIRRRLFTVVQVAGPTLIVKDDEGNFLRVANR